VIYLQAGPLPAGQRYAIRLRDGQGRYWTTKPDSEGSSNRIRPFLVELPPDVTTVTAELVVLQPREATFTVETPRAGAR
jgi:hypothetical protein